MHFTQILGVAVFGSVAFSAIGQAALNGTTVTGSLRFVGNTNYFDPANNGVPSGYGNSTTTNVTVGNPQIEFGYQDTYSRITADFTNTRLTITETVLTGTDATIERYSFTDTAFAGLTPVQVSNSYPVNATASIGGNTLQVSLPNTYTSKNNDIYALTLMITLPGDADLNGTVDFNDFLILQNNFGNSNTRFDQGNFNNDGQTDFNDFLVLQNNFGQSVAGSAVAVTSEQVAALTAFAASSAAVPEPATLGLVGMGGLMLLRRRGRRSSTRSA